MPPSGCRGDPAPRRTGEETLPDQERLGHLLDRLPLLPHGDRERREAHRRGALTTAEGVGEGAGGPVEAELVDHV